MGSSLGFDDVMFPDMPDVLVERSADYSPDYLNGSTHDHNYFYYSFSSYFYQFDFGLDRQDRRVIYIIAFVFLLLLVLFGLLSNVFQLYGIISFPRIRQEVQHIFIANMSIVDIIYLLLVGIAHLVVCGLEAFGNTFKGYRPTGIDMFIRLQFFLEIVNTAVLYHLASMITALAFDQYLVVVYPIVARKWRTPRNAFIACIILWIVGLFVALADGLPYINNSGGPSVMLIKDSLLFIFFCLVPTIMTIAFNMKTWYALHNARTATSTDNHQANNAQRFTQLQEEDGGVPGALVRAQDLPNNVAITASFVVFWVLYHGIHLMVAFLWALKDFDHWIYSNNKDEIMIIVASLAVHFNVALNPLFYATCNLKFRQHLYRCAYASSRRNARAYTGHIDETTPGE